ncbi:MAG TPA: hypothetical protein ENN69_02500, partial [Spirochaetia bacterium]|nr:hypothetical protein [Spirochaetia bacterium]
MSHPVSAIIRRCLEIDIGAARVYQNFMRLVLPDPLATLCRTLYADELEHIRYWRELVVLAEEGEMREVFEDAETILYEVEVIAAKVGAMRRESTARTDIDTETLLLKVIELEYVLLHPSFIVLFSFTTARAGTKTMEGEYNEHIEHIASALNTAAAANPLFPVIGDMLRRVWRETRRLVNLNQIDALSGILNRRGFHEQVRPLVFLALRKRYTVAVM